MLVRIADVNTNDPRDSPAINAEPSYLSTDNNGRTNSHIHRVSKNTVPPLASYNFDAREWILIFFGRNFTDKVDNQTTLYNATSYNLCFCTTCQNGET